MKHTNSNPNGWVDIATDCTSCGLDALVIMVYLAIIDVAILGSGPPAAAQAVFAIPFVVLLPGYAITAALFPRSVDLLRTDERHSPFGQASDGALLASERLALSFGTSLAVAPVLGVVHSVAGLGYAAPTLSGVLNVVILLGLAIGVGRRFRAPQRERVTFVPETWLSRTKQYLSKQSRLDTALTVLLVIVVIAATSSLSLALVAPTDGESFTTLKLLTESESGEFVTSGYPEELAANESASLVLGIENHEGERMSYTVVTELQTARVQGNTTTITGERELGRTTHTVPAGETTYDERTISPDLTGENLRLVFLLYRGEPPEDPRISNAYEPVHLWITVTDE